MLERLWEFFWKIWTHRTQSIDLNHYFEPLYFFIFRCLQWENIILFDALKTTKMFDLWKSDAIKSHQTLSTIDDINHTLKRLIIISIPFSFKSSHFIERNFAYDISITVVTFDGSYILIFTEMFILFIFIIYCLLGRKEYIPKFHKMFRVV